MDDGTVYLESGEVITMDSPKDQRHYEPKAAEDLETEFPGWHVWRVGMLWRGRCASLAAGPASDLTELRQGILSAIWTDRQDAEQH